MEEYDPGLRHHIVHGPSLRSTLHSFPTGSFLDRAFEHERVECSDADKHTCYVSLLVVKEIRQKLTVL